jgi:acetoin utilization deacetylase AcuC-like enzyme
METTDYSLAISEPRSATKAELSRVHSSDYIADVLDRHVTGQWSGARPDLSELAALFAGGTLVLTVLSVSFVGDGLRDAFDPGSTRGMKKK